LQTSREADRLQIRILVRARQRFAQAAISHAAARAKEKARGFITRNLIR
jgi:hypothetical protein